MRLQEKIPNLWRCDFFDSAQTRIASGENGFVYDGSVSGSIIYTYVDSNPLIFIDPLGLANGPAIGWMHKPYPSPTISFSVGGCLFFGCFSYDTKDPDYKVFVPFPPDVGGSISINASPPEQANVCTANDPPALSSSLSFGLGHHLGISANNDGGYSLNLGLGIASPVEWQGESPPSKK